MNLVKTFTFPKAEWMPPSAGRRGLLWMFRLSMGTRMPIEAHWSKNVFSKP
jgi:hypothetical protein